MTQSIYRFFALTLTSLILLLPLAVQAGSLFDAQIKMAKLGDAEAQFNVGEMYEIGFNVKQDKKEARYWISRSANQKHETAGFKLLYWDIEKNGITKDNKAEVDVLVAKAKDGNPQAQFYVGKMHASGVGVKKNSSVAIGWLNKAALVGVLAAENELITVREAQHRQVLAREKSRSRADEKNRAELKAKQEREKQHTSQAKKKARNDDIAKKNKAAADARLAAEKKAKQQAKIVAQAEATARKREAQKQALLKKRTVDEKKRKIQFESDPCSGKSARFLSTCR